LKLFANWDPEPISKKKKDKKKKKAITPEKINRTVTEDDKNENSHNFRTY